MKRRWALVLLTGCQSLVDGAREDFSKHFTCPLERVEGKPRPDLHPSDFKRKAKPPDEIAADPDRLKMWQDKQDADRKQMDSWDEIFEVKGCGHEQFLACHRYNKGQGGAFCMSHELPK